MIHYVVVAGKPDVIAPLGPRLSRAIEATAYFEGERRESAAPGRPWAMAANTVPDLFLESRLAIRGDSLAMLNGESRATSGAQDSLPDSLLQAFGTAGPRGVVEALGGSYNFVGVDPATGLRAFPDFSGLSPLYWSSTPDYVVISNRSTTVAHVTGSTGWALRPLAWVIGHGNLFDRNMPAPGVSYVPPGQQLEVDWGAASARLTPAPTWQWPEPGSDEGRPNLSSAEWEEVVDSLVTNFATAQKLMGDLTLRLTGGKDSRLCLAIAKAAGLEHSIHTYTTGPPHSPEVAVAKVVAKASGFEHRRPRLRVQPKAQGEVGSSGSSSAAPGPAAKSHEAAPKEHLGLPFGADTERTWLQLRRDGYRYEGIINAWSGLGTSPRQAVDVMGWGGELYRHGHSKRFRVPNLTLDELSELFIDYHQPHDPLGILQPEEAQYQREWMQAWVHENAEKVRLDFLPEKFYVEHRLGHWSGPMLQSAPLRIVVNPLLTSSAARKSLELSLDARCSDRFHFEVMRRAAPELVSIPFLNDTWPAAVMPTDDASSSGEPPPASPSTPTPRRVGAHSRPRAVAGAVLRRLGFARSRSQSSPPESPPAEPKRVRPPTRNPGQLLIRDDKARIEELLVRASRETDMGQICNMDRMIEVSRIEGDLKSVEVRELFGCIGVALTLLGETEPVRDRAR